MWKHTNMRPPLEDDGDGVLIMSSCLYANPGSSRNSVVYAHPDVGVEGPPKRVFVVWRAGPHPGDGWWVDEKLHALLK